MFVPKGYDTTVTKKGFNYQHASFDDLLNFLDKHNGIVRDNDIRLTRRGKEHKFTIDDSRDIVYDESGRIIARRGDDGKIMVINDQVLRNILSKNIDIVDYVSKERITSELRKMFESDCKLSEVFDECNFVISRIIPEIKPTTKQIIAIVNFFITINSYSLNILSLNFGVNQKPINTPTNALM